MNIEEFIRQRRPVWNQLEALLDTASNVQESELGPDRIRQLVTLYRQVCSDLNQARSYTANPELLDRLNQLTSRAYHFIYGAARRGGGRQAAKTFLLHEIPEAFQRQRRWILAALAAMVAGILVGAGAVLSDSANGRLLIPDQFFVESPRERVERIESSKENTSGEAALAFGAFLYSHNIKVSFLAFSLAALTLAGGAVILFYNGVILGAVGAMYYLDGVSVFFFAWVGPHGALELPAIFFAGAAGLKLGQAVWLPGDLSREAALRAVLPDIWRMMAACMLILVVAGLIEGSFSQFSAQVISYPLKIAVALVLGLALFLFLFWPRSGGRNG